MIRRMVRSWTSFFRELMGFQKVLRDVREELKVLSGMYDRRGALEMDDKDLQRLFDVLEARFNAFQLEVTAKMAEFTVELKNFGIRLVESTEKQFKLFEDLMFKKERQEDVKIQQKGDEKKAEADFKKEKLKLETDLKRERLIKMWALIGIIVSGLISIFLALLKFHP